MIAAVTSIRQKHGPVESAEEFDARYEAFFNKQDIDSWEIRKAMNDLQVSISNRESNNVVIWLWYWIHKT